MKRNMRSSVRKNLKAHLKFPPSECSYEARAHGVKRNMRGDDARKACPDIQLVQASGRTSVYLCQLLSIALQPPCCEAPLSDVRQPLPVRRPASLPCLPEVWHPSSVH